MMKAPLPIGTGESFRSRRRQTQTRQSLPLSIHALPMVDDRWWVTHMRHNGDLYTASGARIWEQAWTDATDTSRLKPQHI